MCVKSNNASERFQYTPSLITNIKSYFHDSLTSILSLVYINCLQWVSL